MKDKIIGKLYRYQRSKDKVENELTNKIEIRQSVRQECIVMLTAKLRFEFSSLFLVNVNQPVVSPLFNSKFYYVNVKTMLKSLLTYF